MKADIHPEYVEVTVTCVCGHSFKTRSTMGKDFHVEICSECHPFFTGKQKLVDTAGRVDRFRRKYEGKYSTGAPKKKAKAQPAAAAKPAEKAAEAAEPEAVKPAAEPKPAAKPAPEAEAVTAKPAAKPEAVKTEPAPAENGTQSAGEEPSAS